MYKSGGKAGRSPPCLLPPPSSLWVPYEGLVTVIMHIIGYHAVYCLWICIRILLSRAQVISNENLAPSVVGVLLHVFVLLRVS